MTKAVQRRRGTASEHQTFTGLEGEITVNTTNESVHVHDGSTAGGFELARADGSNVDGFSITGTLTSDGLLADELTVYAPTETMAEFRWADGTYNPRLFIKGSSDGISLENSFSTEASALMFRTASGALRQKIQNNGDIIFYEDTGTTPKLTWDASAESLGIGTTDVAPAGNNVEGVAINADGYIQASYDGFAPMSLNRQTSDGDIAVFRKDGTTVGSIGTISNDMFIQTGGYGIRFTDAASAIRPCTSTGAANTAMDVGDETVPFRNLYLSGGVYLGGTGSANLLDDYESGSFELTTASDATGSLDGDSYGYYVKVGEMVTVQIVFLVTANFSSNKIGNLPFTPTNADTGISTIHGGGVLFYSTYIGAARISNNSSSISFYDTSGNAINPSTSDDPFRFTLTYRTS